jgi:hypothetical protein
MANINKLCATLLLIRHALAPAKQTEPLSPAPAQGSTTAIAPSEFPAALSDLNRLLRPDGTLELFFERALPPAAPLLLFRLKRNGFSGCRAVTTPDGILLTALR